MEKKDTISVQWAQEDVETSYSLLNNNEETLVKLAMQNQHVSVALPHLPYTEDCSLTDLLSYLIFCICFGI